VEPTGSTSDEAVVNAMNRAVEALASQIAASIKRGVPMA
jgi:hypothetical protein